MFAKHLSFTLFFSEFFIARKKILLPTRPNLFDHDSTLIFNLLTEWKIPKTIGRVNNPFDNKWPLQSLRITMRLTPAPHRHQWHWGACVNAWFESSLARVAVIDRHARAIITHAAPARYLLFCFGRLNISSGRLFYRG